MNADELDIYTIMKRLETVERFDVGERLDYIEKQLKYFVFAATEMKDKFANGIEIRIDQSSINVAASINQQLKDSVMLLRSEVVEIRQLRQEIKEERKILQEQLKIESVTGALKYMAKQLNELTKHIHEIKEEGIKKQIRLDLTMDGYEMVKRRSKKQEQELEIEEADPEEAINKLFATLVDRERTVLTHRFGLLGEKKKTQKAIAKLFGLTSGESIRRIESRALRKCRHPGRKELLEDITHLKLRTAILGE